MLQSLRKEDIHTGDFGLLNPNSRFLITNCERVITPECIRINDQIDKAFELMTDEEV